jgi:GTPase-associated protein 1, N-terminal domain type 2/GTPase-associated protein 1, middle domain/GTPase-associated protein 1, C-terminal domain
MTGGAFDRLLYTDCKAGTGRGAGGGFQVQAQSAGVDAAQSKMARGWLLYEVPTAWIADRRPVGEFPLGFAHSAEAGYGTAQSCYLGTEATGARQGNHLADCLLTRDQDRYGPTRPAQLWRSQVWRGTAWPTTDCPQLDDAPAVGPLTVDAIAGWLRAEASRQAALASLLTVLEQPAGQRVVITAKRPDEALTWIAAATLLLPMRVALEVSFKVFSLNAQHASHRVVAVSKELNPQVAPGQALPFFVLDADEARSDSVAASDSARFWAALLAGSDDPYDVVDAVELAAVLGAGTWPAAPDVLVTAWALTAPGAESGDPAALFRWLSGADAAARAEHGQAVVNLILAGHAEAGPLRWIDAAAGDHVIDVDQGEVRRALLSAEIAEVHAAGRPPAAPLPPVPAGASVRRDADSELSSAIVLSTEPQVDLLLRLARRHDVGLQLGPLQDRLHAFAVDWVDHPRRDYSPPEWALRDEVLDIVYQELQSRLAAGGVAAVRAAIGRLWQHFADRPGDPCDPLDCELRVAGLRTLAADERLRRLAALLARARDSAAADTAIMAIQRALADWQTLGPAEAILLVAALPPTARLAPDVAGAAAAEIRRRASRPTPRMLDALQALHRRGAIPADRLLDELVASDRDVLGFIQAAGTQRFQEDVRWGREWVAAIGRADSGVLRARLPDLLRACLDFPRAGLGWAVLMVLDPAVQWRLVDIWAAELGGQQTVRAAVEGFCWYDNTEAAGLRSRIVDAFGRFADGLSPDDREKLYVEVRDELRPEDAKAWGSLVGFKEARPRLGFRKDGRS